MQEKPKVSLILTSYNCKDNIKRTLKSIEMQTYPDIEVIIVDGASADGTVDVIKKFAKSTKYECKWTSEKDKGIYNAMNKGYYLSSGEVVAFFNDLFLTKHAVSFMIEAIYREHADGAHADLIYATDQKVKRYWRMGQGSIKCGWMPGHPTLYLKREIYDNYGVYKEEYKCSADYEFMVRILKDNRVKLVYVPKTIIRMYYGGTSTAGVNNYLLSLKEAHKALTDNNIKGAWLIDMMRTVRVVLQFLCVWKYNANEWKE